MYVDTNTENDMKELWRKIKTKKNSVVILNSATCIVICV